MKRLAHIPHSPHRWIDIGENPQDAAPVRGPRGKSVNMQQVIALVQRQVAALLFQRTEAGKVQLHPAGVRSQELRDEPGDRGGKVAHDRVHALAVGRIVIHALEQIFGRSVRNVFVKA